MIKIGWRPNTVEETILASRKMFEIYLDLLKTVSKLRSNMFTSSVHSGACYCPVLLNNSTSPDYISRLPCCCWSSNCEFLESAGCLVFQMLLECNSHYLKLIQPMVKHDGRNSSTFGRWQRSSLFDPGNDRHLCLWFRIPHTLQFKQRWPKTRKLLKTDHLQ